MFCNIHRIDINEEKKECNSDKNNYRVFVTVARKACSKQTALLTCENAMTGRVAVASFAGETLRKRRAFSKRRVLYRVTACRACLLSISRAFSLGYCVEFSIIYIFCFSFLVMWNVDITLLIVIEPSLFENHERICNNICVALARKYKLTFPEYFIEEFGV